MEPPLHEYERKRDFRRTPEPRGDAEFSSRRFVVQKHDARRLHYDLRLELEGVLKSWAVPKGPSYDPDEKRLAVHVEDHPLDYADFEGVIPAGEYGAGAVQVWDFGTWEPVEDPKRGYGKGHLHFRLHGARLHGEWTLARMGGAAAGENKENWLLIKVADAVARAHRGLDDSDGAQSVSVLSGRTLAQIASSPRFIWTENGKSNQTAGTIEPTARGAPMPSSIEPQLATLVDAPPRDAGWLHEIKFDGYRTLARIHHGEIQLISRNGKDWTHRFDAIARALRGVPVTDGWLDGEIVVLDPDGRSSFSALQLALSEKRDRDLIYFLFDLLYRDGADLRALALAQRKAALADLLADAPSDTPLRLTDHLRGEGDAVYKEACRLGLEGVVAKRADAPYRAGRGRDWVKIKCLQRQEFVIGGFSAPSGVRNAFGALLVGVYDGEHLIYTGRVGTGFDEATLRDLHRLLTPLAARQSPFHNAVPKGRGEVTWVRPELVAEIAFAEWTRDNILRQAVFHGLREDKSAREVVREGSTPLASPPATRRNETTHHVAGQRLSHPDKIYFPSLGLTKRDIADYYARVAELMLPDLARRPLTLVRCPEGAQMPCFYQKHANHTLPPGISTVQIAEKNERADYLTVASTAGIIGLVQMGVLEIHTWGAHADNPEAPDRMVFDLDPDEALPWEAVLDGARLVREALAIIGLHPFLRATGGKGLHIVVPLTRRHRWEEVKEFAHALVSAIVHEAPSAYTANPSKAARRGKLYLDYLRNSRGATAIANYSTRAKPGAPIAVPLRWDELGTRSDAFHVADVQARIAALTGDPWEGYGDSARTLTKAMKHALGLT